jgi:hypothetical protein
MADLPERRLRKHRTMANIPDSRPSYEGKALAPNPQSSQGTETSNRANSRDLRKNKPMIEVRRLNPTMQPKNPHSENCCG